MFVSPEAICLGGDVVFYSGTESGTRTKHPTFRVLGKCFGLKFFFLVPLRRTKKTETHSGGRVFYRGWLLSLCADQ